MEKTKLVRNAPHQKYHLSDGTQVPGGSTICKIGDDAGALIHWAWDLGKRGLDYRKERDKAADIGTLAHFMIECMLNNQVADLSDYDEADIAKALVCYTKFLDWWELQNLKVVETEIQLVNEEFRYGGTIDLIAVDDDGDHVLLDFKTSKKISESYWRQCAGYAQLWNANKGYGEATKYAVDILNNWITNHAIVRIGKQEEGDFEVVWKEDLSKEWNVFQHQVDLYWAMQGAKPEPKRKKKK
jgi:hypothetical protein